MQRRPTKRKKETYHETYASFVAEARTSVELELVYTQRRPTVKGKETYQKRKRDLHRDLQCLGIPGERHAAAAL
jgi:hypothetical protein